MNTNSKLKFEVRKSELHLRTLVWARKNASHSNMLSHLINVQRKWYHINKFRSLDCAQALSIWIPNPIVLKLHSTYIWSCDTW